MALERIAFLHIPKSGGTSLRVALATRWPEVRRVRSWPDLPKVAGYGRPDLVAGHFKACQLSEAVLEGFTPITVFRDPFRRLLSSWHFAFEVQRRGPFPLNATVAYAVQVSFAEFAFSSHGISGLHQGLFQLGLPTGAAFWEEPLGSLHVRAAERLAGMRAGVTESLQGFSDGLLREAGVVGPLPKLGQYKKGVDAADDGGLTRAQRAMLDEIAAPGRALHRQAGDQLAAYLDRVG